MYRTLAICLFICPLFLMPELSFGSIESSLQALQGKLTTTILPVAAIIGVLFAAFSFVTGNANAKTHLTLVIIGCAVGFLSPSIIEFIKSIAR